MESSYDSAEHEVCHEKNTLYNAQPQHMMSDWVEPETTTELLTMAVLLPSGVFCRQFAVRVAGGGCALEASMTWPILMVNLQTLHRESLQSTSPDQIENYHPKLIGFERFQNSCRTRSADKLESKAKTNFPCQVQTHIFEKFNLGWSESGAKVIYVKCRGQEDYYGTGQDNDYFEVCCMVK